MFGVIVLSSSAAILIGGAIMSCSKLNRQSTVGMRSLSDRYTLGMHSVIVRPLGVLIGNKIYNIQTGN
jgi:hypothetical protein